MTRKKIKIFAEINNEKEFQHVLRNNRDRLICAEVYSYFAGWCTALDRLFATIKLDWTDGRIILLKVPSDETESLRRFRNQSEPVYLFVLNEKVTKVFRGVDSVKMAELVKDELYYYNVELAGLTSSRPLYALDEPTQGEKEWIAARHAERMQEQQASVSRRMSRQAARKRHRAELMVPYLHDLNFVLFWPHATYAHVELYERWDLNSIIMVGREELVMTKEKAEDILYAGDAPINEASMFQLLSGPVLAICFRLLDADKHFVTLTRKILYEELPQIDDDKPITDHSPRKTAFDLYKSYSLTREEIWQLRKEERMRRKEEEKEKRTRRLSEMQRLAKQAHKDVIEMKKMAMEHQKLELLRAGNLTAFYHLNEKFEEEEDYAVIPEELPEEIEEVISNEEDENEYFPPAGLIIPGFYAPPDDIAKANGLAILFPKLVAERVTPQPEFLPPHVLVMLAIDQRYTAIELMLQHRQAILHMGIFKGTSPYDAIHVAYSVKQYDQLNYSGNESEMRLAFMVSIEVDIPVLEFMDLNPLFVSRDPGSGEDDCAAIFPVDYGDGYPEFEDFRDRRTLED